jgi:hypothetical protein
MSTVTHSLLADKECREKKEGKLSCEVRKLHHMVIKGCDGEFIVRMTSRTID